MISPLSTTYHLFLNPSFSIHSRRLTILFYFRNRVRRSLLLAKGYRFSPVRPDVRGETVPRTPGHCTTGSPLPRRTLNNISVQVCIYLVAYTKMNTQLHLCTGFYLLSRLYLDEHSITSLYRFLST